MKVLEALKVLTTNYPVPQATLEGLVLSHSLEGSSDATKMVIESKNFQLAKADLLDFVSKAPDVEEGGIKFTTSVTDRKEMREEAATIRESFVETEEETNQSIFGYKGTNL